MSGGVVIHGPAVRSFDARAADLDEHGLRRWVRAWSTGVEGPHVSRSYCYPYAVVAWHTEPVGVDLERVTALDAGFAATVCSARERAELETVDGAELTSLWSSKEALAKAFGDALDYDPRLLESPLLWPDGECGPWRAVKIQAPAGHVAWVCWRVTQPAPAAREAAPALSPARARLARGAPPALRAAAPQGPG